MRTLMPLLGIVVLYDIFGVRFGGTREWDGYGTGQFLSIIVTQKELMVKKLFKQLLLGDICVMCTAGNKYLTKLRTTEYFDDEFKVGYRGTNSG